MNCSNNNPPPQSGEERKLSAHAVLEVRREALLRLSRRTLLERLLENGEATIDDVRELIEVPEGINAKFFGAVPGYFARLTIITAKAMVKTRRSIAHARHVTVWRLRDVCAAKEWLRTHPVIPIEPHEKREGGK